MQADADPADVTLGLEAELLRAWSSDCSALADRGRRDAVAFRLEYIGMVRPGRTDEIVQGILDRLRDLSIEPPAQSGP